VSVSDDDIRGWFAEHRAEMVTSNGIETLKWRKPGSSNFSMVFISYGAYLVVLGDAGEAVYQWSQMVTLEWVAGCHIGYILSKCQASPEGRQFEGWDEDHARARLADFFEDDPARLLRILDAAEDHLSSQGDWTQWLHDTGYQDALVGEDWVEHCDIGMAPTVQARAHVIGLQMAVEQLSKGGAS